MTHELFLSNPGERKGRLPRTPGNSAAKMLIPQKEIHGDQQ
jgi:hypothetical protein